MPQSLVINIRNRFMLKIGCTKKLVVKKNIETSVSMKMWKFLVTMAHFGVFFAGIGHYSILKQTKTS